MKNPYLQTPFQLGDVFFPNNIFYAPLAGCTDFPFRKMSSRYRPGLIYCEMIKMDALVRNDQGTFHMLDYDMDMHPIGGQICGSKPAIAGKAARIIEELGFDVVDLNCGCPVDKVTKDGSGSAMLKTPELIGEVIASMVASVKIPVTVKIRAGWDENNIIAPQITKIAEQAGAKAICIHGRTRQQAYKGPANWDYIKQCVDVATHIKIIGNGDITDAKAAQRMFEQTGCDAVLVARGTMGQPWIIEDIVRELTQQEPIQRDFEELRSALLEHFTTTFNYHPERRAVVDMRRVGCWYFKKATGTSEFRKQISRAESAAHVRELITAFPVGDLLEEVGEMENSDSECC
jgi:tRNA-dihydrouridine synthase B